MAGASLNGSVIIWGSLVIGKHVVGRLARLLGCWGASAAAPAHARERICARRHQGDQPAYLVYRTSSLRQAPFQHETSVRAAGRDSAPRRSPGQAWRREALHWRGQALTRGSGTAAAAGASGPGRGLRAGQAEAGRTGHCTVSNANAGVRKAGANKLRWHGGAFTIHHPPFLPLPCPRTCTVRPAPLLLKPHTTTTRTAHPIAKHHPLDPHPPMKPMLRASTNSPLRYPISTTSCTSAGLNMPTAGRGAAGSGAGQRRAVCVRRREAAAGEVGADGSRLGARAVYRS